MPQPPDHDRFLAQGFLDEPLTADVVDGWPAWAQEHFRSCSACQSFSRAESLLYSVGLDDTTGARSAPAPNIERLAPRPSLPSRPPPPEALLCQRVALPSRQFRLRSNPLHLVRTTRGVRAHHPDARCILIFTVKRYSPARLLYECWEERPGLGLDVELVPDGEVQVVGVAAGERLDSRIWSLWVTDMAWSEALDRLVSTPSTYVHVSRFDIPAPITGARLMLTDEKLPPASPQVTVLLQEGAAAGRSGDLFRALDIYSRARSLALDLDDPTGDVKATYGMAFTLRGMDQTMDAQNLLTSLLERRRLDARQANWMCRYMAYACSLDQRFQEAEFWNQECHRVDPDADSSGWLTSSRLELAYAAGEPAQVLAILGRHGEDGLPEPTRPAFTLVKAWALASTGRPGEARRCLGELGQESPSSLHGHLVRQQAEVAIHRALGDDIDWPEILGSTVRRMSEAPLRNLAAWETLPLLNLCRSALECGREDVARALFLTRFFDPTAPAPRPAATVAIAAVPGGHLLLSGGRMAVVPIDTPTLHRLVISARDSLIKGDMEPSGELGRLLFPADLDPGLPLLVASDGALSDAPLAAAAWTISGLDGPCPVVTELAGPWVRGAGVPPEPLPTIASLADPDGTLPMASQEVAAGEASTFLRGAAVKRQALSDLGPVGLIHIGLHSRRDNGAPELICADGPVEPSAIARLELEGGPVVLLAGCATGNSQSDVRVGRSLAGAFLKAGASHVLATRWPVEDSEFHPFSRAIVENWPTADLPAMVARVSAELKRAGFPARTWAAPAIY